MRELSQQTKHAASKERHRMRVLIVMGVVTDVTNSNQVSSPDPLGTKILPAFYLLFELRTNLAK